jgi:mycothiol synthase
MLQVTVRRPFAPADVATIRRLAELAEAADGHPSLGDSVWRDLEHPASTSTILVASADGEPVGALHIALPENDGDETVTMGLVVEPRFRDRDVERALTNAALDDASARDRRALLWIFGADEQTDRLADGIGFTCARELHQMRAPLPLSEPSSWPPGVDVRRFGPGRDESAWLAVNNRAFADDPDQRGWTLETLLRREEEPWFDPDGFLLAWRDGALAGFCWTKVHPASTPNATETLGEIYVIGVDPDHQGIGLGRALVVGGLACLHQRGATVGMLFVDAANTAAIGLYEALGFTTTRVDRAYVGEPS